MSDKFQNKYRIPSARLQNWDYGSHAAYFVTICTKHREHYFGEILNNEMQLNEIGTIAEQEWIKTPTIRPDMNLELGNFVVMPNHFHAILIIGENEYNTNGVNGARDGARDGRDVMHHVSTDTVNKFGPQSKNLASIIRGFKSSVTTHAKKIGIAHFEWQSRFHDHIIRNAERFEIIQNYITNNTKNWNNDKFYS